jgi:putative hydrolase of the HAD superfamily
MAVRSPKIILFDFFGTLVHYEATWTELAYPDTHGLVAGWGVEIDYAACMAQLDEVFERLEEESARTLAEFSGPQTMAEFAEALGLALDREQAAELIATYLREWVAGVVPIEGVPKLVGELGERYRLGIVSNTHNSDLVPSILRDLGIADAFEHVLLSVDHGYRKPHLSIYQAALHHFGCDPVEALFVGDNPEPDYHGPRAAGIPALIVDPDRRHPEVSDEHRIATILDLETALSVLG